MGVPIADSLKVAELIGVKIFLNEFAAYQRLGRLCLFKKVLKLMKSTKQHYLLPHEGTELCGSVKVNFPCSLRSNKSLLTLCRCDNKEHGTARRTKYEPAHQLPPKW